MFYIFIILQNKYNNRDDCDDLYEKALPVWQGLQWYHSLLPLYFMQSTAHPHNIKYTIIFQENLIITI